MKRVMTLLSAVALVGCSAPDGRIDDITLLYLNNNVYSKGAVVCKLKEFGERTMIGCRNEFVGGEGNFHIWELRADGVYYAINGNARGLAERQFSIERRVRAPDLPLPADIDVSEILRAFQSA